MIFDSEQEALSQRKNKLSVLLNKNNKKRTFCFQQHKIIKQVLEPPKRVFSYSRSIRHFQEIMSKTGSISLNKKVMTLFMRREDTMMVKQSDEMMKLTNSKLIQTDDLMLSEYGFKTDRLHGLGRESPYIKKRKFSQHHVAENENLPKQPYLKELSDIQKPKYQTFQNEVLQQKVPKLSQNHFRTTHNPLTSRKQRQLVKIDTIFTTITQRY
ncbi:hypothetical protein FGO68_gene12529 [Halteria grandinella]|uniref:Uncharacterized protein n=1 Tax=Halteria grandinella TaxID=5974 RepID=A0A8J8NGU5_HALGN|nr:hypothetical protein FGO68_gene12529 [Halteria grandinella]